jgi:hypothetical protein
MKLMTDTQRFSQQVEAVALDGLTPEQSAEARPAIERILEDWLEQAAEDPALERQVLVEIGLADLEHLLRGKTGGARVATLHFQAMKPPVQRTSGRAFDLATQVADRKMARQQAAPKARELREKIFKLMQEVKLLREEDNKRALMRELADADLEIRYVLEKEEGAISIRLNHYIRG